MPFLVWKTIGGKKRLVMRWNKRINGKARITKEIYIGDMENLARIVTGHVDVDAKSPGIHLSMPLFDSGSDNLFMMKRRK